MSATCYGEMSKMIFASFVCLVFAGGVFTAEDCDKSKCNGPLRYYEDLRCQPIYSKSDDCCPISYNCSELYNRSTDKCYINGQEYAVGEKLKVEDRPSPCYTECICQMTHNDIASFSCASVDCFNAPPKQGCRFRHLPDECCPKEEICPDNDNNKIKCEVDGKTYLDGDAFTPESDPNLSCYCMEGYIGENIKPFCRNSTCGTEINHSYEVHENCAPVYYSSQPPTTSCSLFSRCQNENDTVIPMAKGKSEEEAGTGSADMTCKFGNMIMQLGDELNKATDYSSVCVKCVCQVPPLPTCQRLPDDECDVTKHPPFHNY